MIREILKHPHEILLKRAEEVKHGSDIKEIVRDLFDTWHNLKDALGLAAPQIGIPLRIFLAAPEGDSFIFVNPVFSKVQGKYTSRGEGCLSIPRKSFDVKRAKRLVINAYDEHWNTLRKRAKTKKVAIVLQHEMDHLDGKTIMETGRKR